MTNVLAMEFAAPGALWALLGVLVLALAYVLVQLRRPKYEVRFTNVALLDVVAPNRPSWRRHLTAAVFLLGAGALVVAAARPHVEVQVARERATIVLAIDVSLSMMATDVAPSRLDAAQTAAREFVDELPDEIDVGLVAFDGIARILVPPTSEHASVQSAISGLELGPATAIGEALFASVEAAQMVPPGADGDAVPARIVLMSDGATTVGRPDEEGAAAATQAGIPVYTISFGTPFGTITLDDAPGPVPVPVAPEPLRAIADTTGGAFFEAETLEGLSQVYTDIGSSIGFATEQEEVTYRAVWAALVLLAIAAALSLAWSPRLP